jgi:hypothetical protein
MLSILRIYCHTTGAHARWGEGCQSAILFPEIELKENGFCRLDDIKRFEHFTLQPK